MVDFNSALNLAFITTLVKYEGRKDNILGDTKMHPDYITGFADGESSFVFSIFRNKASALGWTVSLEFKVIAALNPANELQFKLIKDYFKFGSIFIAPSKGNNSAHILYKVSSLKDCIVIRDHFLKYPLATYKLLHFQIWCKVLDLLISKEHLTEEGLNKLVALKEHSPNGISPQLIIAFPLWENYKQPLSVYSPDLSVINLNWLAGFIQADGHFGCTTKNASDTNLGKQVLINIDIAQHIKSVIVLEQIINILGVGKVYLKKDQPIAHLKIQGLKNINLFLQKFDNTKLYGAKELDYLTFCNIVNLMNEKKHLTKEGLAQIEKLISTMNSQRTNYDLD